jgi:hypothetical protein
MASAMTGAHRAAADAAGDERHRGRFVAHEAQEIERARLVEEHAAEHEIDVAPAAQRRHCVAVRVDRHEFGVLTERAAYCDAALRPHGGEDHRLHAIALR